MDLRFMAQRCVGVVEVCRGRYLLQLQRMMAKRSCSRGGRGGGVWRTGEVCRSGEGMWDSAVNGTVG